MAKKKAAKADRSNLCKKVTVEFNQDYVAARGAGIAGAEGDTKTFAWSSDLAKLIDEEVVTVVRTADANKRETAASK